MTTDPVIQHGSGLCHQTSIVCRIRNRNEIFADTIQNWQRFPVPEIIVVDYRDDGCQSVWDIVKELNEPRIKVIETKYEYMFSPTIAWNLGISQVTSEYVLLLDVDNVLYEHFFGVNMVCDNEFICGKPIKHLWGSCLCKKDYIDAVNGFDENCIYMGHGDTNLYHRLEAAGYLRRRFVHDSLYHKDHPKDLTISSQITLNNGNAKKIWVSMKRFNEMLTRELPWTPDSPKTRWRLEPLEPQRWLAVRNVARCPLT